jgi:hypothetical protein
MPIEGAVLFELHKLCATFSASVNINYRLPIKVYYRICTLARLLAKRKKEVMLELKLDLTRVMLMLDSIVCVVVWIDSHLSI